MFNLADATYARVPRYLPLRTAVAAVAGLAEHVRSHGGARLHVILHGGEPSLWPLDRFQRLFAEIQRLRSGGTRVDVALQTNGLKLAPALLRMLTEHGVTLGVSLDGPEQANDRFRVGHDGRGSYARVIGTLDTILADGFDPRRLGILSVINPALAPEAFLDWASSLPTRHVSLLWPIQYSWARPPWDRDRHADYESAPRYGTWMAAAFASWWQHHASRLHVRQFVETIARIMGSRDHSDSLGNDFIDMFVVNTDGGIEYPDYLRAHRDGGSRTPFHVERDLLEDVARDPTFATMLALRAHLPGECARCPEQDVCGGGFLAGRAGAHGFDPALRSVLCYDQLYFYQSVRAAIAPYLQVMAES
jgi:uncharacterized protein